MAKTNSKKTVKVLPLSAKLADLVRPVLREMCDAYEWNTGAAYCVSRDEVAKEVVKRHADALPENLTNQKVLYHLIGAAVEAGQFPGFAARIGRNGGIYAEANAAE